MVGETFEVWAAEIAASAVTHPDAAAVAISLAPRGWLVDVFGRWGPLSRDDVAEVAQLEREQLAPLVVGRLTELLPPVLADAHAWGNDPVVQVRVDEDLNVRLSVSWAAGCSGGPTGGPPPLDGAAAVIAWLADAVQEVTMERDQVDCRVWPVCASHRLGGHALLRDGVAVWWCNGAGGHVLAAIGELSAGPTAVSSRAQEARTRRSRRR